MSYMYVCMHAYMYCMHVVHVYVERNILLLEACTALLDEDSRNPDQGSGLKNNHVSDGSISVEGILRKVRCRNIHEI